MTADQILALADAGEMIGAIEALRDRLAPFDAAAAGVGLVALEAVKRAFGRPDNRIGTAAVLNFMTQIDEAVATYRIAVAHDRVDDWTEAEVRDIEHTMLGERP